MKRDHTHGAYLVKIKATMGHSNIVAVTCGVAVLSAAALVLNLGSSR
jgi:hypothetical protein